MFYFIDAERSHVITEIIKNRVLKSCLNAFRIHCILYLVCADQLQWVDQWDY